MWSRTTADRFIALAQNKDKVRKLRTLLPASALYLLAKAPPSVIRIVEQRIEAGERLPMRTIQGITAETSSPRSDEVKLSAYVHAPYHDQSPIITGAVLHRALAARFVARLDELALEISSTSPETLAECLLTEQEQRAKVRDTARQAGEFLLRLAQILFPESHLHLVVDQTDDDDRS